MFALEFNQTRHFLDLLMASRELTYGQDSESLIKPCESMIQCLRMQGEYKAALATIQTCLNIIAKVLNEPTGE